MGRSRACQNGNRAPRRLIGFAHAHSRPPGAPPADVLLCELRWGTSRSSPPCGSVLSFSAAATAVGDRNVLEPHGSSSAQVSADAAVAGGDGRGIADDHRGGVVAAAMGVAGVGVEVLELAERGAPADSGAESGHHVGQGGDGLLTEQGDDGVGGELGWSYCGTIAYIIFRNGATIMA